MRLNENLGLSPDDLQVLEASCDSRLQYELVRELLDVERRYATMVRRAGLFQAIDDAFKRSFYEDEEDATERARKRTKLRSALKEGQFEEVADMLLEPEQSNTEVAQ